MNNKIYIIFFVMVGFILNIFFYLLNDDYRYFMQSLKSNTNYEVNDKFKINLDEIIKTEEKKEELSIFSGLSEDFNKKENDNLKSKQKNKKKRRSINYSNIRKENNKSDKDNNSDIVEFSSKTQNKFKITKIEEEILKKLEKYKLKKVEISERLFGLTNEYPDEYKEYYNKDFSLYLFGNKHYSELEDIFNVLGYEIPISINKVNNFGQKSFYINLNELFKDNYVRIVIEYKNRTFGLKIKNDYYKKIKNDLGLIFHK